MARTPLHVWWLAIRPKTLGAAIAPVIMGVAIAYSAGQFHGGAAIAAMAGALLLQIAANFANDYFDWRKGADDARRVGPIRVVSAGLVAPATMRIAIVLTLLSVVPIAVYLVWRAGPAFIGIGAASILFALLYTGGPRPLAYIGLGDVAAFAFFGPIAVAGTYAAQSRSFEWLPAIAGIGPGCLAMTLLAVNNLRDREGDARANKRTLAVRFGAGFARAEIVLSVAIAAAVPVVLAAWTHHWGAVAATATCITILPAIRDVLRGGEGHTLNRVLASTGRLIILYGFSFAIGWMIWW
ncbi:MAG: 1,4-dihydroxy-2-naphthoate polyprenyltransferase [Phycisphaerae bacterium]|jgi:1,4-dihydroxy-2-naphthoate octaprenyltransferase|nr:1,4-dihydroxy-2-naphthoate polyprenyltransferase [Phycisphaerae bacterium]